MLLDIILWGIALIALIGLAVLIARKWRTLTSINVDAIPAERLEAIKTELIEERIKRRIRPVIGVTKRVMKPAGKLIQAGWNRAYEKLRALEDEYKRKRVAQQVEQSSPAEVKSKQTELLTGAEEALKAEDLPGAEKRFIEAISVDPKQPDAYYGLGEVYLQDREYEQARETFSYLITLNPDDDQAHHELGQVAKALGQYDEAVREYQEALRIAPNNPKYLDSLVDIAILKGDKVLAWESFDRLRSANPENQKLDELKKSIEALEQSSKSS